MTAMRDVRTLCVPRRSRKDVFAGQQRGAFVPWRTMVREDSGAFAGCRWRWLGVMLVGFVVVDPECSVVPVSL